MKFLKWLFSTHSEVEEEKTYIDVVEPTKEQVLNVLSNKEPVYRSHINWLNKQEGLPLIEYGECGDSWNAYCRLREYAVKQKWVKEYE